MKYALFSLVLAFYCVCPLPFIHASDPNTDVNNAFDAADKELNQIYAAVRARLDDVGKEKLRNAQRAWLAFRDAQAELHSDVMRGGSGARLIYVGTQTSMTEQRVKELREHFAHLNNLGLWLAFACGVNAFSTVFVSVLF